MCVSFCGRKEFGSLRSWKKVSVAEGREMRLVREVWVRLFRILG